MARVLLIGGTDSSGGAGLARDVATAARMGVEPCVAVTAVTAQTDASVLDVRRMSSALVSAQVHAAGPVDAAKIGMLGESAIVRAVAEALPDAPLVLDPVLSASSGRALLDPDGVAALFDTLLPRTTLLTPNLPELGILAACLGLSSTSDEATRVSALMDRGCGAVLVKGGHAEDVESCEDRLYLSADKVIRFTGPRFAVALRGTGCQLATGIAVSLAQGRRLPDAIDLARRGLIARFREAATANADTAPRTDG
ncbi:hypothetical protein ATO6_14920 [Oceanicola sp. 22II-s10i]|uniref:bifunctional hydroxymethylpyrimidine kinase/phosphomethylpyrimidine kinase n=1 Tax=Oceanicola sp. 22II-s10i TaxID=1317116 RepID=UPI000B6A5C6C|nr:hydroxymethylpyrimidine/phosphomethylpyrimidine kinase [Oceanicola sp. 22II-s10i]OWU84308.1 hypothetical protein ATO6_14920 [Oceanicola sp. 22II-s10i]